MPIGVLSSYWVWQQSLTIPFFNYKEGVSSFIGLCGINGTLTSFLGLLTEFKRKLDLTVVAIPPKAGMLMR